MPRSVSAQRKGLLDQTTPMTSIKQGNAYGRNKVDTAKTTASNPGHSRKGGSVSKWSGQNVPHC